MPIGFELALVDQRGPRMEAERRGLTRSRGKCWPIWCRSTFWPAGVGDLTGFGEIQVSSRMPQLTALMPTPATRAQSGAAGRNEAVRAVLFDLDEKTLVQQRGLVRLFREPTKPSGSASTPRSIFSVALKTTCFMACAKHCRDHARADEAASHFLDLLQREYNPEFVPGMSDVVKALAGNCSLAVISSNSWQQFGAS